MRVASALVALALATPCAAQDAPVLRLVDAFMGRVTHAPGASPVVGPTTVQVSRYVRRNAPPQTVGIAAFAGLMQGCAQQGYTSVGQVSPRLGLAPVRQVWRCSGQRRDGPAVSLTLWVEENGAAVRRIEMFLGGPDRLQPPLSNSPRQIRDYSIG